MSACQEDNKPYQTTGFVEVRPFYLTSPQGGELRRLYVNAGESVKKGAWVAKIKGQSTLKSPASGRVLETFYLQKEHVSPGSAVVSLLLKNEVFIVCYIPENDLNRIHVNKRVTIRYRDHDYPAEIKYVAAQAEYTPDSLFLSKNRHKSVFKVKIALPKSLDAIIKVGQMVEVIYE
jgi:multidrug efflux pump subunit AcrA (membrane-fusion protein)